MPRLAVASSSITFECLWRPFVNQRNKFAKYNGLGVAVGRRKIAQINGGGVTAGNASRHHADVIAKYNTVTGINRGRGIVALAARRQFVRQTLTGFDKIFAVTSGTG